MRLFHYYLSSGLCSLVQGFVEAHHPVEAVKRIASKYGFEFQEINGRKPVLVTLYEVGQPDEQGFRVVTATPIVDRPLYREVGNEDHQKA